jgi:hypothetical protein
MSEQSKFLALRFDSRPPITPKNPQNFTAWVRVAEERQDSPWFLSRSDPPRSPLT